MNFERSTDWKLIKAVVTHPRIYDVIADDFSPSQDDWQPVESDRFWYVLAKDGEELLGLWAFHPLNGVCYEVHTCLLPNSWGSRARIAAKEVQTWAWLNMPCRRVVTEVPAFNRLALKFAKDAGFIEYGINPKSYLKHGTLHDIVLLGLQKPEAA